MYRLACHYFYMSHSSYISTPFRTTNTVFCLSVVFSAVPPHQHLLLFLLSFKPLLNFVYRNFPLVHRSLICLSSNITLQSNVKTSSHHLPISSIQHSPRLPYCSYNMIPVHLALNLTLPHSCHYC